MLSDVHQQTFSDVKKTHDFPRKTPYSYTRQGKDKMYVKTHQIYEDNNNKKLAMTKRACFVLYYTRKNTGECTIIHLVDQTRYHVLLLLILVYTKGYGKAFVK